MCKDNETLFMFPAGSVATRETCYLKLTKATRSPSSFVLVVHSCHNFLVLLFIYFLQIQLQSTKKF